MNIKGRGTIINNDVYEEGAGLCKLYFLQPLFRHAGEIVALLSSPRLSWLSTLCHRSVSFFLCV